MALKIEDGTGVVGANSYATVAYADAYLAARNRQTENGWDCISDVVKDAAMVAGTDFIELRWGLKFKGCEEFINFMAARATLTFTQLPADTETVTINGTVYVYNTTPTGGLSMAIGASITEALDNLVAAIAEQAVDANGIAGVGNTVLAQALVAGTAGNTITTVTTVTNAVWSSATLLGGSDAPQNQPLAFPRDRLYDRNNVLVVGIPDRLKQATVEYAVRSVSTSLYVDPTVDDTGRAVIKKAERVGPISEETTYAEGGALTQENRPYPAADRLLAEYVYPGGGVIRG